MDQQDERTAFDDELDPPRGAIPNGEYRDEPGSTQKDQIQWEEPDMAVLRLHRRPPPALPLQVFGPWQRWIENAAKAAACPADYVVGPLLASASVLIGNARWPQANEVWQEPPHLWIGVVGHSGNGKSPGADCLFRDVLPEIERSMRGDYPERLWEWKADEARAKAADAEWLKQVAEAQKHGGPSPAPPMTAGPQPQEPRLRQNDVTIERVASLLAGPAPKGLLVDRDELYGWIAGMNNYNEAGRAFWVQAYGGRSYKVERQRAEPISVPRLAVGVYGGVQPDKLAMLFKEADDGLLSRFLWLWPEPLPFELGKRAPDVRWAIDTLDRLRALDLAPGDPPAPVFVPVAQNALPLLVAFGQEMQKRQESAVGLMQSALGKFRGSLLRLSLVLECLWWSTEGGRSPTGPAEITEYAIEAAALLLRDYFLLMAEGVYGDAAVGRSERGAATLAKWIIRERRDNVHVRTLQREVRLPGLNTADLIKGACDFLVEADWLRPPPPGTGHRPKVAYPVNPLVFGLRHNGHNGH